MRPAKPLGGGTPMNLVRAELDCSRPYGVVYRGGRQPHAIISMGPDQQRDRRVPKKFRAPRKINDLQQGPQETSDICPSIRLIYPPATAASECRSFQIGDHLFAALSGFTHGDREHRQTLCGSHV